jgi:cation transport ATPase
MWRRLESLFAALAVLAAFGGAYYLRVEGHLPSLINIWSGLALAAAALSFFGVSASIHGHRKDTRLTIILGFLLAVVVALLVNNKYNAAYFPEAAVLLLVLICAELRVFTKEPATRKPENVGAIRRQLARRRR